MNKFRIVYISMFLLSFICFRSYGQKDNKFGIIGLSDDKIFIEFFNKFKNAVKDADSIYISQHINYPLEVHLGKRKFIFLEQKKEFLKQYDQIFDDGLKKVISSQTIDSVDVSEQFILLRNGQIFFNCIVGKDGNQEINVCIIYHEPLYPH
ncbi:MAG: hypothetical protein ABSD46_06315 [Bacteroidota bacterium]